MCVFINNYRQSTHIPRRQTTHMPRKVVQSWISYRDHTHTVLVHVVMNIIDRPYTFRINRLHTFRVSWYSHDYHRETTHIPHRPTTHVPRRQTMHPPSALVHAVICHQRWPHAPSALMRAVMIIIDIPHKFRVSSYIYEYHRQTYHIHSALVHTIRLS